MLRTNLSTRPFYNERAVRAGLGALAVLAIGLTVFNAVEIIRLQGQSRDARETIARNEAQAGEMREKARVIRQSIDRAKLGAVQIAAQEANALIDRRTFSWTELLNQFERTLPADVRIGGVTPQFDDEGRRLVQITVFSRRIEAVEAFMDALEKTGAFSGVLPRSDRPDEDAGFQTDLQADYHPQNAAVAAAPASESGAPSAGNTSASPPVGKGRPQ